MMYFPFTIRSFRWWYNMPYSLYIDTTRPPVCQHIKIGSLCDIFFYFFYFCIVKSFCYLS